MVEACPHVSKGVRVGEILQVGLGFLDECHRLTELSLGDVDVQLLRNVLQPVGTHSFRRLPGISSGFLPFEVAARPPSREDTGVGFHRFPGGLVLLFGRLEQPDPIPLALEVLGLVEMAVGEHQDLEGVLHHVRVFGVHYGHVVELVEGLEAVAHGTSPLLDQRADHEAVVEQEGPHQLHGLVRLLIELDQVGGMHQVAPVNLRDAGAPLHHLQQRGHAVFLVLLSALRLGRAPVVFRDGQGLEGVREDLVLMQEVTQLVHLGLQGGDLFGSVDEEGVVLVDVLLQLLGGLIGDALDAFLVLLELGGAVVLKRYPLHVAADVEIFGR